LPAVRDTAGKFTTCTGPSLEEVQQRFKRWREGRKRGTPIPTGVIKQLGFLMLGGPGEIKESAQQSLNFSGSLQMDAMKITIGIRIYPKHRFSKTCTVSKGKYFSPYSMNCTNNPTSCIYC